jgi:hypothetical protein
MTIGWYIHHHGRGHLHRFLAVAPELTQDVTVLSSLARPEASGVTEWIDLPPDVPVSPGQRATVEARGLLHWAPLGESGYRERMGMIAAWIAATGPAAIVVDVSVEVALLARLMGVPVLWVAQRGIREDRAHRLAYGVAEVIIAPWTADTDPGDGSATDPDLPAAAPVVHVGALSRFDHLCPTPLPEERRVGVVLGFGGHAVEARDIAAAAAATPDWTWEVAAHTEVGEVPNVISHPPDCDVWALLNRAAVVVSSASGNAVAEVAAARRPLICLPQDRPFAEQHRQAAALSDAGLALVSQAWPPADRWPGLLERARAHGGSGWAALHDGAGARRFAAAVDSVSPPCG